MTSGCAKTISRAAKVTASARFALSHPACYCAGCGAYCVTLLRIFARAVCSPFRPKSEEQIDHKAGFLVESELFAEAFAKWAIV
jgi:hypothetical protein